MARDDEAATAALRERSAERLKVGFQRVVDEESARHPWDSPDAMLRLTPFVDCARRLGLDPAEVLGPLAQGGAAWFSELFVQFVRRADVTLAAFGWSVVETPEGPAYRFAWPNW